MQCGYYFSFMAKHKANRATRQQPGGLKPSQAKLTANSANMATDAELQYSPGGAQWTRAKLQLHALREAIEQAQPIKSTKMH